MSFREWLPVTARNLVALGLAALSLVMFVIWNCLPYSDDPFNSDEGIVALTIWPRLFSSQDHYIMIFRYPHLDGFLFMATIIALIQNALVTLVFVPLWKLLHASLYLRVPLAFLNLFGGVIVSLDNSIPYEGAIRMPMAAGMFALSAALFTFKNELALRSERMITQIRNL